MIQAPGHLNGILHPELLQTARFDERSNLVEKVCIDGRSSLFQQSQNYDRKSFKVSAIFDQLKILLHKQTFILALQLSVKKQILINHFKNIY
jgi:hypothetical protein